MELATVNDIDSDFYIDLDTFIRPEYDKMASIIVNVYEIEIPIPVNSKFIEKYQLNDHISFSLRMTRGRGKVNYRYEGVEIKPDCHFITPDYYVPVPTLTVLREAIKQNTHEPDIKPLELELAKANELVNKDNIQVIEWVD